MPQRHRIRRLIAPCALLLLIPALALAGTTRACLESGLAHCAEAPGGEQGRLACLDGFLAQCKGWCPDVATPCALEKLKNRTAADWRDSSRLAAAIADACFMESNCPPPREEVPVPLPAPRLP